MEVGDGDDATGSGVSRRTVITGPLGTGGPGAFAGDTARGYAAPAHAATTVRSALTVFQPHVGGGRT